jgi:hypothetical protein
VHRLVENDADDDDGRAVRATTKDDIALRVSRVLL